MIKNWGSGVYIVFFHDETHLRSVEGHAITSKEAGNGAIGGQCLRRPLGEPVGREHPQAARELKGEFKVVGGEENGFAMNR